MTPNEFVIWLKGFAQAANNFTLTPKQWDDVKEKLDKVVPDNHIKGTRYNLDNSNSNWSTDNSSITNQTVTHGRPEYSITYTTK